LERLTADDRGQLEQQLVDRIVCRRGAAGSVGHDSMVAVVSDGRHDKSEIRVACRGLQQTIASGTYWRPPSRRLLRRRSDGRLGGRDQCDREVPEAICLGVVPE
jgi:hypothetical protein